MNKRKIISLIFLFIISIVISGIIVDLYFDITTVSLENAFKYPDFKNIFGTDELGRDIFMRTLSGSSLSLRISIIAWVGSIIIGLTLGSLAGYYPKTFLDKFISFLINYAYATPFIIFLICLLGAIGPGLSNAYLILLLFAWAAPARQARVMVREIRDAKFILAAKSYGYNKKPLLFFVIIPYIHKPILIASLATLPEIIALDAGLSFFGLGVQPPSPSIGKMISDGLTYLSYSSWIVLLPTLFLLVICIIIRYLSTQFSYLYKN